MKTPLLALRRVAAFATILATPWVVSSQTPSSGSGASSGSASGTSGGTSSGIGQRGATGSSSGQRQGTQNPNQQMPPGGGSQPPKRPGGGTETTNPSSTSTGAGQSSSQTNSGGMNSNQPSSGQRSTGSQATSQNPGSAGSSSATGTATGNGSQSNSSMPQSRQQGINTTTGARVGASVGATGTISAFDANGFSLSGGSSGAASSFLIGPGTAFTDSTGRSITREQITKETPVTVYYQQSGNSLIATRVVANDAASSPYSDGTIREVSPGVLVIEQPGASSTPVRYVNDNTTNYVDRSGQPVNPDSVGPGTPVKIFYTKVGDTLVASRVEVQRGSDAGLPKPSVEATSGTTTLPETRR